MRETWATWIPLRGGLDVTVDDAAIDGSTKNCRLTDFTVSRGPDSTRGGITDLPPGTHMVQVGFYGETPLDATGSFSCEIWMGSSGGPWQTVCDVTGLAGDGWADLTQKDLTTRLFYDDLSVSDITKWNGDVTTGNLLSDGMGWVSFCSRGQTMIWPRFYNIGDTTEVDRIKALMRCY
jgi:hypothetical protein